MKNNLAKIIGVIGIFIFFVATISAVGSCFDSINKSNVVEKEFYEVGEEVEVNNNILLVSAAKESSGYGWSKPKNGKRFVIVLVTIKNNGDKEIDYSPSDFRLENGCGQIDSTAFTTIDSETCLHRGTLAPGGVVSGTVTFEESVGDYDLKLLYKVGFFDRKEVKVKLN